MNLNKTLSSFFLFLLVCQVSLATTINGKVSISNSSETIVGAHVWLKSTQHITTTNRLGKFNLANVEPGEYQIIVSSIGFITLEQTIKVDQASIELNFDMKENLLNLPQIVIESTSLTGGRENIKNLSGSAHYISTKKLDQFSSTDVNRTLKTLPGVYVQEEDGYGLRPNIGMRGTGLERSSKITLMEDGILMAPAPYTAPAAYYFPTMGRMESIEVVKGSKQIEYGPQTSGGAINMISTAIPSKEAARVQLLYGKYNTQQIHSYYGKNFGQVAFNLEVYNSSSDGFKELKNNHSTGFELSSLIAKLRLTTKSNAKVFQSLMFKTGLTNEHSNETYLGLSDVDFKMNPYQRYEASSKDNMVSKQAQFSLKYYAAISKNIDFITTLYRNNFERNWYKFQSIKDSAGVKASNGSLLENSDQNFISILEGTTSTTWNALTLRANNRSYYAQGIQSKLNITFKKKALHKISIGTRIHKDGMDRFQWEDTYDIVDETMSLSTSGIKGTQSNRLEYANAVAAFTSYEITYKKLKVIAGVRYENVFLQRDDYGKKDPERVGENLSTRNNEVFAFIPGASLQYNLHQYHQVFTGIHKGFSPPGSSAGANPEQSVNMEMGYRLKLPYLTSQLIGFNSMYSNLLGSDLAAAGGLGTNELFNAGKSQVYGLEFELETDVIGFNNISFPIRVAYGFTEAKFLTSFVSTFEPWGDVTKGDYIPNIPKQTANLFVGMVHQKFDAQLQFQYSSEIINVAGNANFSNSNIVPSYSTLDFSSHYYVSPSTRIFLGLNNVFNSVYAVSRSPFGLRPGMPRNIRVGVKWNLI